MLVETNELIKKIIEKNMYLMIQFAYNLELHCMHDFVDW